jgi:hypothetical protein
MSRSRIHTAGECLVCNQPVSKARPAVEVISRKSTGTHTYRQSGLAHVEGCQGDTSHVKSVTGRLITSDRPGFVRSGS